MAMKEYNKKNLLFLAVVFSSLLTVFFTVVLLSYLSGGWWALPFPLAGICYGIYSLCKKYIPKTK